MADPKNKSTTPFDTDTDTAAESPSTFPNSDIEKAAPAQDGGDEIPDGGFTAWLVVFGAWCTSFCSFGWLNGSSNPVPLSRKGTSIC